MNLGVVGAAPTFHLAFCVAIDHRAHLNSERSKVGHALNGRSVAKIHRTAKKDVWPAAFHSDSWISESLVRIVLADIPLAPLDTPL